MCIFYIKKKAKLRKLKEKEMFWFELCENNYDCEGYVSDIRAYVVHTLHIFVCNNLIHHAAKFLVELCSNGKNLLSTSTNNTFYPNTAK